MIDAFQLQELIESKQLDSFAKHLKIKDADKTIPFVFNKPDLTEKLDENSFVVIGLASNDLTTFLCAYTLHKAIWEPDKTIMFLSPSAYEAKTIIKTVSFMYENLPLHLRSSLIRQNSRDLQFENGSRIISIKGTGNSGCGLTISLLILNQFNDIKEHKQLWIGLYPTVCFGKIIITDKSGFLW